MLISKWIRKIHFQVCHCHLEKKQQFIWFNKSRLIYLPRGSAIANMNSRLNSSSICNTSVQIMAKGIKTQPSKDKEMKKKLFNHKIIIFIENLSSSFFVKIWKGAFSIRYLKAYFKNPFKDLNVYKWKIKCKIFWTWQWIKYNKTHQRFLLHP